MFETLKEFATLDNLAIAQNLLQKIRKQKLFVSSKLITTPLGIQVWYMIDGIMRTSEIFLPIENNKLVVRVTTYIGQIAKLPILDSFEYEYGYDNTISGIIIDIIDELKK